MAAPAAAWLLPARGVAAPPGSPRLVCLGGAGGAAWMFHSWAAPLAARGVAVLPVELPGHGARLREPRAAADLAALAAQLVDALAPELAGGPPCAIFGHSMGAWLAWEVAQELARRGLRPLARLFVSGNRAPWLAGAAHDPDATRLHALPPDAFWAAFERRYGANASLADPVLRALAFPVLRDDFAMVERYAPSAPEATTAVPITAVGARLDRRYSPEQLAAWARHAAPGADFQTLWLEGVGHGYVADAPPALLSAIAAQLAPLAGAGAGEQG
ncbi:lgrE [Scenedesmus sp. PABB004]|nr:lgrE [Scenedesmus sp. PABB004]